MRSSQACFLGILAVLLGIGHPVVAAPLSDVLHLVGGAVVSGSIVEEVPGRSYTVETVDGKRFVYPVSQVQRIEKRLEPVEYAIQQRTIVFLAEGVVFRGVVVERVPGGSMVLELANGRLLRFSTDEIAKIVAEPVAGGVAAERPLAEAATHKAIVEFQIVLVQHQLSDAEKKLREAAQGSDAKARLEAEVDRLRQELEALAAERERAGEEADREEQETREFAREYGGMATGLREAGRAVTDRADSCSVPELRSRMRQTLAEIDAKAAEIIQRVEVIARAAEPDPRLVPIQQVEHRNEIQGMIANRLWDDPAYRGRLATAAAGIPVGQRQQIYRENRREWVGSMFWNMIPCLCVGSWTQGDVLGAGIGTAASIGGVILAVGSMVPSDFSLLPWETPLGIAGITLAAAGYLYSLVQPAMFASDQNERLAKALGLRPGGGAP